MQTLLQMLKSDKNEIKNVGIEGHSKRYVVNYKNDTQEFFDIPPDPAQGDAIYNWLVQNNKLLLPF